MLHRKLAAILQATAAQMPIVTLVGPRQSGKTTIAKSALEKNRSGLYYYNWDRREVRERYREEVDFLANDLLKNGDKGRKLSVCFDEIHKYPKWKNILKYRKV